MNINFFEKKERNVLPYLVGGIFVLLLLAMAAFFYFRHMMLSDSIDENQAWIDQNTEQVSLAREISQYDERTRQAETVQETLEADQFPMDFLSAELASIIPDENNRVASMSISESNQITLILENTVTTMGQQIVEDLESLSYIEGVQFLSAQNQAVENNQLQYELIIDFDEATLKEVAAE